MSNNNQSSTNSSLPNGEGGGIVRFRSSILPDLLAIVFFIALSFAYFIKPVSEGLVLTGQDHSGGTGAASEMEAYRKAHNGERTRWTNVLFSGMPTYQIAPSYPSTERSLASTSSCAPSTSRLGWQPSEPFFGHSPAITLLL